MNPLFSIIIPTYNRAELLNRALKSLEEQTYKNFEVLVCDDGSKDNTKEIVKNYYSKLNIKYIYCENSGGPARPRNIGIDNSIGDWICFLDSDDYWKINKLEICLDFLEKGDFLYHHLEVVGNSTHDKTPKLHCRQISKIDPIKDLLINWNGIATSSVVVKKQIILQAGKFDVDINLVCLEDFDLWIRISALTRNFILINQTLGFYNLDEGALTSNIERQITAEFNILNKYRKFVSLNEQKRILGLLKFNAGMYYLKKNKIKIAREYFSSCIKSQAHIKVKLKSLLVYIMGVYYFKVTKIIIS